MADPGLVSVEDQIEHGVDASRDASNDLCCTRREVPGLKKSNWRRQKGLLYSTRLENQTQSA